MTFSYWPPSSLAPVQLRIIWGNPQTHTHTTLFTLFIYRACQYTFLFTPTCKYVSVFACLYLQAVGTTLLIPLGSGQSWRQCSLWQQQDLRALAQHVEARFIVHITLVGVSLFTEQEGPTRRRQERRDSMKQETE